MSTRTVQFFEGADLQSHNAFERDVSQLVKKGTELLKEMRECELLELL